MEALATEAQATETAAKETSQLQQDVEMEAEVPDKKAKKSVNFTEETALGAPALGALQGAPAKTMRNQVAIEQMHTPE